MRACVGGKGGRAGGRGGRDWKLGLGGGRVRRNRSRGLGRRGRRIGPGRIRGGIHRNTGAGLGTWRGRLRLRAGFRLAVVRPLRRRSRGVREEGGLVWHRRDYARSVVKRDANGDVSVVLRRGGGRVGNGGIGLGAAQQVAEIPAAVAALHQRQGIDGLVGQGVLQAHPGGVAGLFGEADAHARQRGVEVQPVGGQHALQAHEERSQPTQAVFHPCLAQVIGGAQAGGARG